MGRPVSEKLRGSDPFKGSSKGVRPLVVLLVAVLLSGCVKRAIVIESDPPGALVQINGRQVGETPLEHEFITHGGYVFTLSKSGFQEVVARERVMAPWHQWIPLDVVTELLIPAQFNDVHTFHYSLQPLKPAERIAAEPPPRLEDLRIRLRGATDPTRRREACVLMARHHMTEGIPTLQDAVRDPHPEVRAAALQALRVLTGPNALPALLTALQDDADAVVRWQAAAELEVLRLPEARPALESALDDADPLVRATAVEALRGLGDRAAVPAVAKRLQDSDIVVRRSAADALGRLGDRVAAPALGRALRDPDPEVRRRAAKSLLTLKAPEASEPLAQALRDRDPTVRATAVQALHEFGTPAAVPIALQYVRSWQPAVRGSAAQALGGLRDPSAIPSLERAARREPNERTREAMLAAVQALKGTES